MGGRRLALLGLCVWGFSALGDSVEWSDSGIKGPPYSEQLKLMESWREKYPRWVTIVDYGTTLKGRQLRMLVVKDRKPASAARPTLLLSGSTHGNEYLNLEDRIPEKILENIEEGGEFAKFVKAGGAFVFVPILNPDGYDLRRRGNSKQIDLNRDWDVPSADFRGFREIETRELAKKLHSFTEGSDRLKYRVSVDYHCCIGALLHPWSHTTQKLPADDLRRHQSVGEVAQQLLDVDSGTTPEILGYSPTGTTKDYYYSRYGTLSFTYEGRKRVEKDRLDKHVAFWEAVTGLVYREMEPPLFSVLRSRASAFLRLAD